MRNPLRRRSRYYWAVATRAAARGRADSAATDRLDPGPMPPEPELADELVYAYVHDPDHRDGIWYVNLHDVDGQIRMEPGEWEALGRPDRVTVWVRPGDHLRARARYDRGVGPSDRHTFDALPLAVRNELAAL